MDLPDPSQLRAPPFPSRRLDRQSERLIIWCLPTRFSLLEPRAVSMRIYSKQNPPRLLRAAIVWALS